MSRPFTISKGKEIVRSPSPPPKSDHKEDNKEHDDQELEAHYIYMAKIQEVLPATKEDTGPTYDTEPLKKVHSNDECNVFANEVQHTKQPKSINDTYVVEKDDINVTLDSSDMSNNEGEVDQQVEQDEDKHVLLA
ncbi:hypothetical protein Tco_0738643 [Tanacetum coccineum]